MYQKIMTQILLCSLRVIWGRLLLLSKLPFPLLQNQKSSESRADIMIIPVHLRSAQGSLFEMLSLTSLPHSGNAEYLCSHSILQFS